LPDYDDAKKIVEDLKESFDQYLKDVQLRFKDKEKNI